MAPERYSKMVKMNFWGRYLYPCAYTCFSLANVVYKFICRFRQISREKYDLAIAFSGHYNDLTFVAKQYVKAKKLMAWLHGNIMSYAIISDGFLNLYSKIKNLIVLNEDYQSELLLRNNNLHLNVHKIYNPSFIKKTIVDEKFVVRLRIEYGSFLMMVGRLGTDKDQLTLIKAFEYIKKKYQFSEKLLLIGDGMMREQLEQYVQEHQLESQVLFMGSQYDVQNWYSAAYLFVHSSPAEGLPTTLIEALSFDLPIVATNSMPGVGEILDSGKYGEIVPIGDWKKLGEAIYRMYHNKELYMDYKKRSSQRACDFAPDKIKKKIQIAFQELIK